MNNEQQVSYIDLGFDAYGMKTIGVTKQIPANSADFLLELSESSVGTSILKALAVTDQKIKSVSADKLTAGTLAAVTNIGDESIQLDGENKTIKIFNDASPANVSIYMKGGSA